MLLHKNSTATRRFALHPVTLAVLALMPVSATLAQTTSGDDVARTTRTVSVTGSTIDDRFGDNAREPSSTVQISGRKIEAQHADNLAQVLKSIPGVTVDFAGGDELKIKFRGVENQRYMGEKPGVAIVIDGVPVFERTGKVNIDLDNIDSIKVIKGGASYLFGEDALSGAVVITTKRGANNRGVQLDYDLGAYDYQRLYARGGFAQDEWSGHLQYAERSSDEYHFQSNYKSANVGANLRWAPDRRQDISLGLEVDDRFRDKHGTVTGVTQAETDPRGTIGRDYARHFDVNLDRINLTYSNDLDDDTNLLALVYRYQDHTKFWSSPQRYDASGKAVTSSDAYTTDNDYHQTQRGVKIEVRRAAGDTAFMLGGELKRNEYINDTWARVSYRSSPSGTTTLAGTVFSDDITKEETDALYGELKWSPLQDWTFTGNGRLDSIHLHYASAKGWDEQKNFDQTSWRGGAAWAFSPTQTYFANISTGFRAPSVEQLYRGTPGLAGTVASNPDLKPERAINYEVGVRSVFQMLGRDSSLEAALFQIDRKDFILDSNGQYSASNAANISRYENIGGQRSRGLELALKSSLNDRIDWDVTYTYLDARFTQYDKFLLSLGNTNGKPVGSTPACTIGNPAFSWNSCFRQVAYNNTGNHVPRTPPHKLDVRTTWKASDAWRVSGEIDYQADSWADEINQEKWPGRTVFNLVVDYSRKLDWPFAGARLSAFMRIDNVFDTSYYNIARGTGDSASPTTNYKQDGVYNAEDLSITVNPGRVWRTGVSLRF